MPAKELLNNKINDGGSSQNERLFNRGNAMSGAPINNGSIQLPNPPNIKGITIKKIITKACLVTHTLYFCPLVNVPGFLNSNRINKERPVPTNPHHIPKIM